jgi:uncharacterized membrane protein YGL010W
MNAIPADNRRPVERLLGNYAEDHRNPTNQVVHWICVPLIVWTVVALLWVIPVPPSIGKPGLWAALAMALASGWYFKLSRTIGFAMLVAFVAYGLVTFAIHRAIGSQALLWTAIGVFVAAWIAQFIGHQIEGRRPSFLTDMTYLLVGPMWLLAKGLRKLGIAY